MSESKDVAVQSEKGSFIDKFQANPDINKALVSYLGDEKKLVKFVSSMRMCFALNPKLKECTSESLRNVFLNCAEWELYPSHSTGECYVIPYKNEATFQLGYQGMVTLAYRAGIKHMDAQIVYANDLFEYEYGMNPNLKHVPEKFSADRGEAIGAYAVATLGSGIQKFEILSASDIFKHRAKSQSWKGSQKYSPWNPDNDPQLNMWKKTCIKQLFKMLPKSPAMQQAVAADVKGDIIDVTPDVETLSQSEITDFYKRMSEGWDNDTINEVILSVRECGTLDKLTMDEAVDIEEKLLLKKVSTNPRKVN